MSVARRLENVRQRICAAARSAGRDPDEVTLIGVCKRQPIERIFEAHDHGVREFGENTVQGLAATARALASSGRDVRWHYVGRLQRNKIRKLLPYLGLLQTVDRGDLVAALDQRLLAGSAGVDVLVQVNVGREPQKGGVDPDDAIALARTVARRSKLHLLGLMGMPPFDADPKPYFELLAQLSRQLQTIPEGQGATVLSMGMTDDFETAIACGATHVRVGTAIFGERATNSAPPIGG
ncbi:MAG: YggS family pyridoxal phosphate-dependent enzyme [Myxococcota bacterium]